MSAATISRWNAIPLERPPDHEKPSNKRTFSDRRDASDEEDDNVSLVSRPPSPVRRGGTPTTYDDDSYVGERETITIHTRINSANKGHNLLLKMGWKEGQGLGVSGQGRPDPIPFVLKSDSLGLGKLSQDLRVVESTIAQRRDIESERQSKETAVQRQVREAKVAQKTVVQSEIKDSLKIFYCELCDKQYANVAQYDEHVRSYAHTHKQRVKEVAASQRAAADSSKLKEKERKREEKELRKIAAAAGIKLPSVTASSASIPPPPPDAVAPTESSGSPTKKGWKAFAATVTAPALGPPPTIAAPASGGFKKAGWATVGAAPSGPSISGPPPFTPSGPPPLAAYNPSGPPPPPNVLRSSFQSTGFTTLDTSQPGMGMGAALAPPPPQTGGWNRLVEPTESPAQGGWNTTTRTVSNFARKSQGERSWNPIEDDGPPPPPPEEIYTPPPPPPSPPRRGGWNGSAETHASSLSPQSHWGRPADAPARPPPLSDWRLGPPPPPPDALRGPPPASPFGRRPRSPSPPYHRPRSPPSYGPDSYGGRGGPRGPRDRDRDHDGDYYDYYEDRQREPPYPSRGRGYGGRENDDRRWDGRDQRRWR